MAHDDLTCWVHNFEMHEQEVQSQRAKTAHIKTMMADPENWLAEKHATCDDATISYVFAPY